MSAYCDSIPSLFVTGQVEQNKLKERLDREVFRK